MYRHRINKLIQHIQWNSRIRASPL